MTLTKQNLLVISNGEAEDAIACRILQHLKTDNINFIAAPLVSHGNAYLKHNIPICCPTASLPSCGFNNQSARALKNDFQSGLGTLLIKQIKAIRSTGKTVDHVITCGDIVPQIMGVLSGKPFVSIFTAQSDYYIRDHTQHFNRFTHALEQTGYIKRSSFTAFDRALMKLKRCRGVFVRDKITHDVLKTFNINSYFLGNPMMDNLETSSSFDRLKPHLKTLLLLPGSRTPEVFRNLDRMIDVIHQFKLPYNIAMSVAPNIDLSQCQNIIQRSPLPIHLIKNQFSALLNHADAAFAMCGTAAEQAIGKGLAVISMPGKGPQFTLKFSQRQQRLLGPSYTLVIDSDTKTAQAIEHQIQQSPCAEHQHNGLQRMGPPGGSRNIAQKITELLHLPQEITRNLPQAENIT